jgi:hypothetical protein
VNDKERLRRKIKLIKETILKELEVSEDVHPKHVQIGTSFLLDIIREYEWLQQEVDRLSQENISWQKHEARQETKIHDLEMKISKLKRLGDPTLWGVYEIEKYRELMEGEG